MAGIDTTLASKSSSPHSDLLALNTDGVGGGRPLGGDQALLVVLDVCAKHSNGMKLRLDKGGNDIF